MIMENLKFCRIKHRNGVCCLKYINFKYDLIDYKCLCCNKNYQKKFDKNLKKRFVNTYKFFNHCINNVIVAKSMVRSFISKISNVSSRKKD